MHECRIRRNIVTIVREFGVGAVGDHRVEAVDVDIGEHVDLIPEELVDASITFVVVSIDDGGYGVGSLHFLLRRAVVTFGRPLLGLRRGRPAPRHYFAAHCGRNHAGNANEHAVSRASRSLHHLISSAYASLPRPRLPLNTLCDKLLSRHI